MSKYSNNMPGDIMGAIGWLLKYIKPNSTVLDFGCSTGYFGSYIKKANECSVYGVEISEDKTEASKVLDGVYSFDLDDKWPDEVYERKYDYLFFGDVLEHLKDSGDALKQAKNLLNDKGVIFVSIPNIAHISTRLELLSGSFQYEPMGILDNTHLKYFTLDSFTRIANEAGYSVKLVDFTENDIPKEIITSLLEQIGITSSDKFWKIANGIEARAYQYKFILSKSEKPENNLITPVKPLQFRDDYMTSMAQQLNAIHAHADDQAKIIKHKEVQNEDLHNKNEELQNRVNHLTERAHVKLIRITKAKARAIKSTLGVKGPK